MRKVVDFFLMGILLFSCATDRPTEKGPEKVIIKEGGVEKEEAFLERVDALERSLIALRSEVGRLEERQGNVHTRTPLTTFQLPTEVRLRKEVELQKTRDYFCLDLPMEAKRYVYKITAAKIILSDPGRYGFYVEEKQLYDPLQVERIQIEVPQPLPIMEVAWAIGFFYKEIKELNPHLFDEIIPAGNHILNLPPGTSERFWIFFQL